MTCAAIATMVWSMKVIDTAKIIAVRIRLRDRPPVPAVLPWLIVFPLYQDQALCAKAQPFAARESWR